MTAREPVAQDQEGSDSHRAADTALLRAYEPILAYTAGELFFPAEVESYAQCCSLWRLLPGGSEEELIEAGELTLDRLAEATSEWPGDSLHLRFVQQSSLRAEARRWRRTSRPVIARSGRLAAVGLVARIIDVIMRISLLVRGVVPGGGAAAAASRYHDRLSPERCAYYGRVHRDGGYVTLQYWYFYAMNDWRSTFGGVNDHEADWEMVAVYLAEAADGGLRPVWVGVSSHEYTGDDLRRRWDDPELRREGDHPVVFVGAGSHSGQVVPGDYLIRVDPEPLRGLVRTWHRMIERLFPWTRGLQRHGIGIPFVDYHRGDGIRVGPGGQREWQCVRIDDGTPWLRGYRGLWGRDTRDWLNGERAPTGPRYDRSGLVRWAWADPLGWMGLQKVAPNPAARRGELAEHLAELESRIVEVDTEIATQRAELRRMSAASESLAHYAQTKALARQRFEEVEKTEEELAQSYRLRARLNDERTAHSETLAAPPVEAPPQAHLQRPFLPYATGQHRPTRLLQFWVALSTPLLILSLAALLVWPGPAPMATLVGIVLGFAAIDAFARRKIGAFLAGVAILAVLAAVIAAIVWAFVWNYKLALLVPLAAAVVVLLVINIRDLIQR